MIAIEWHKPEPSAYDCLLAGDHVYILPPLWMVWAAALRWLWEQWLGMIALFVAGMALTAQGRGWKRAEPRQLTLWAA